MKISRQREYYDRQVAKGLCVRCPRPARIMGVECDKCAGKSKKKVKTSFYVDSSCNQVIYLMEVYNREKLEFTQPFFDYSSARKAMKRFHIKASNAKVKIRKVKFET